MVRLSKIYTKSGDKGETMLGDGSFVAKDCPRVEAYGEVDEANASVGAARLTVEGELSEILLRVQHDLFDVGADLCTPIGDDEKPGAKLRVQHAQVERLEREIDSLNEHLTPLNSFVLPGGSEAAAALHVARTTVRRAERRVSSLLHEKESETNAVCMVYLNRLSDLLFVIARVCNGNGTSDVLWEPGHSREGGAS
ncbi:MAG: cob(I)yrinic acid a,c-diamide adenosyltransferase [Planctomycetota bacterium]